MVEGDRGDDGDAIAGVVVDVLANIGEVSSDGNAPGGEVGAGAHATEEEELGAAEGTRTKDHLAPWPYHGVVVPPKPVSV